jgi:hypothetical protein
MIKFSIITFLFLSLSVAGQVTILNTDFQSGIPSNYTILNNDGLIPDSAVNEYTSAWIAVADPENTSDSVASSTSFFSPVGQADRWLITPPLPLGNYGNFIQWQAKSQDASFSDDYLVLVSTTDNQPSSFTDTIGFVIEETPEWTTREVDLSEEGYNNQTIYIAFRNITDDGFKLYIDDINVWKEDASSIQNLSLNELITIYPNPSKDFIQLTSISPIEYAELFDLTGKSLVVFKNDICDLRSLPKGIYLLVIKTSNGLITKKILKD